ncbi:MAG TPA: outer membrane lipoprotein carrier protein LolA [bacterium]|nr:outer membrane lipoprotein carrier protein LolA [bacterium]
MRHAAPVIIALSCAVLFPQWANASAVSAAPAAAAKKKAAAPASGALLSTVLRNMGAAEKKLRDLSADITQTKYFGGLDDTTVFKGIFRYRKPRRLYWEFVSPDRSVIVVNEREALMYIPDIKQVQKIDARNQPNSVALIFGFDRSVQELQKTFSIRIAAVEPAGALKRYVLAMKPRDASDKRFFTEVRLWISSSSWMPEKIKVYEVSGDRTTTELANIRLNAGIDEKTFEFTPPPDAEVVDVGPVGKE